MDNVVPTSQLQEQAMNQDSGNPNPEVVHVVNSTNPELIQLEWVRVKTATATYLKNAVSELERFGGELGHLNHFLKRGNQIHNLIEARISAGWVDPLDATELRASLVGRVRRNVLNGIQADELTPWEEVTRRLKKAYGGGRWTPEEDIYRLFTEIRQPWQSDYHFAEKMLTQYTAISEKLIETVGQGEAVQQLDIFEKILKVQLGRNLKSKEKLATEKSFVECVREIIDKGAREEEESDQPWQQVPQKNRRSYRDRGDHKSEPLRNPRFEPRKNAREAKDRRQGNYSRGPKKEDTRRCYECNRSGHIAANCPSVKCFECGNKGHVARACPWIYKRTQVDEPMEVNNHRTRRPRYTSTSSSEDFSEKSSSDEEKEQNTSWAKAAGKAKDHSTRKYKSKRGDSLKETSI